MYVYSEVKISKLLFSEKGVGRKVHAEPAKIGVDKGKGITWYVMTDDLRRYQEFVKGFG